MTAQLEHSQCPLVEIDSINSLFIVYRYDSSTGTFTVPSGGDGFYYFSAYLLGRNGELSNFDLQINGDQLCSIQLEQQETSGDFLQSSCSATTYAAQGNSIILETRTAGKKFLYFLQFFHYGHLLIFVKVKAESRRYVRLH